MMGNSLFPQSWGSVKLVDIIAESFTGLVRSAKEQDKERPFKYLKMNNLSSTGDFELSDLVKIDASDDEVEKYSLNKGDLIFNTRNSAELVGKCGVFSENISYPLLFNNNLLKLRFSLISPHIVSFWLNSPSGKQQLREITSATTSVAAIYQKQLFGLTIPVPPLAEQKVIADKLDELLAQVQSTKARLDRIPDILKRFRQSVLAAAVSGKLTEEWRKHNDPVESAYQLKCRWLNERKSSFKSEQERLVNLGRIKRPKKFRDPVPPDVDTAAVQTIPESWELVSVSEYSECLDSQRIPVKREDRQGKHGLYPYFGANGEVDRVDDYIFDDDLVLVTEDETFYGRIKPIAYRFSGKCWVNNHAHVLRAQTKEANDYLCYALMYYRVIPWLSGTTGRAKLTQAALNSLPIGLPSHDEITEIVQQVEMLFVYADKVEQKVQQAQERVNQLTQSILAKAFRGELTEQWRKDNPDLICDGPHGNNSAQSLLEKIKAEREAAKPKKKTRKKA